ncbi:uncharacterized protein B0T15DRAFT_227229 [Chaetomium strumarium]|uniref:Secreted protein n=1 Tax=Chaetomium strumarium TaxID=1170767 RepID=A0AAJ0M059_9PEZI|nr:hypothetical protein B0T15DRAFT_227229 [Chaetomium strumarium]
MLGSQGPKDITKTTVLLIQLFLSSIPCSGGSVHYPGADTPTKSSTFMLRVRCVHPFHSRFHPKKIPRRSLVGRCQSANVIVWNCG